MIVPTKMMMMTPMKYTCHPKPQTPGFRGVHTHTLDRGETAKGGGHGHFFLHPLNPFQTGASWHVSNQHRAKHTKSVTSILGKALSGRAHLSATDHAKASPLRSPHRGAREWSEHRSGTQQASPSDAMAETDPWLWLCLPFVSVLLVCKRSKAARQALASEGRAS
jgi:hypothetical protein